MSQKWGRLCPLFGRRAGSPSSTMWRGPRPTSVPSATLIHPAIWSQWTWTENWGGGCAPFLGRGLGPHLTQCSQGRGLSACQVSSWSVQPFGPNTPTSQTGQDRQRSDSIGWTVLQTVAQKPHHSDWAISSVSLRPKNWPGPHQNLGFGSVFTENRGFGFGFETDSSLVCEATENGSCHVVCEWEADTWGRAGGFADLPCIHAGSNDATFRWLSLLCGIARDRAFRKQCPERPLRSENTVKHRDVGVRSMLANHGDGGESSVVVRTLVQHYVVIAMKPIRWLQICPIVHHKGHPSAIPPSYISVHLVMWACGLRQTDRHTHT